MRYQSQQYKYKRSYASVMHKNSYKSRRMWGSLVNFLSPPGVDLDNLSEVIRINRCKRSEGKGGWKVLPKDSWDLYTKYKKRRQLVKKNDKSKKKQEKSKPDTRNNRGKTLKKSKKVIKKRQSNSRKKNSIFKTMVMLPNKPYKNCCIHSKKVIKENTIYKSLV